MHSEETPSRTVFLFCVWDGVLETSRFSISSSAGTPSSTRFSSRVVDGVFQIISQRWIPGAVGVWAVKFQVWVMPLSVIESEMVFPSLETLLGGVIHQ